MPPSKNDDNSTVLGILTILLLFVGVFYFGFSWFRSGWDDIPSLQKLWDAMGVMICPLYVLVAVILIRFRPVKGVRERQNDLIIEQMFQAYFDQIGELLVSGKQVNSETHAGMKAIVRAKTLALLPQLDGERKGKLILFLIDAGFLSQDHDTSIDLSKADLRYARLRGANLAGLNFAGADFEQADLMDAHLEDANLEDIQFTRTYLGSASLMRANLQRAHLVRTNLMYANLEAADLTSANLSDANTEGLYLADAVLKWANLTRIGLYEVNLTGANLYGAKITQEQLASPTLHLNETTILPDGTHWKPPTNPPQGGSQ